MNTVNPYCLHKLLAPLVGLADDMEEIERFSGLDPNDEHAVKAVIRDLIVPHAASLDKHMKERVRTAYQYYLTLAVTDQTLDFERVFNSILPPFDPPSDARLFFLWVWEECFPGELFNLLDISEYTVKADIGCGS